VSDGGPPRFFHEGTVAPGTSIELDADESGHGTQSLRLHPDDIIELVDGQGHLARARVTGSHRRRLVVSVIEQSFHAPTFQTRLIVGLGLLKGPRFDLALEKLTELGADVVVPLLTHYSEVPGEGKTKFIRWGRILLSAMKQSRRVYRPELREPIRLRDLLAAEPVDAILVGHPAPPAITEAPGLDGGNTGDLPAPDGGKPVAVSPSWRTELLLVGPEGGWAPGEIEQFRKAGATFISLGPNRLRAETAAMALLTWRLSVLGVLGPFSFASRDADPDEITS